MKKNDFSKTSQQISKWVEEDKENRGVIMLTIDRNTHECTSTMCGKALNLVKLASIALDDDSFEKVIIGAMMAKTAERICDNKEDKEQKTNNE